MKVAVELQPCLKNRSGIGIYTYELSKRLQHDRSIELIGDVFNFINRNDLTEDLRELEFNKEVCTLFPYGIYRRIWHYIPIQYHYLFKREVDLTHFFNFIVPPHIKGKVITTIYDLTFEFFPETMDKRNLKRLKQDIEYSIERADHIITISECSKRDMVRVLGIEESKIDIIYPGVDFKKFHTKPTIEKQQEVREKYGLPDVYLLYMGTLEPRKNIPTIVEAFAKIKKSTNKDIQKIKLVIAGKKGWLFESIFKKVEELGLESEVIFTDYVKEEDKVALYSGAKVFVFPSLYEGFGIPLVEAMAAGVPVITSNTSSLPEVVGEAGILVEPMDSHQMAAQIKHLIEEDSYYIDLVEKGFIQAKKFNWDDSAKKLRQVYERIL